MKKATSTIAAFCLFAAALPSGADTFTLKDGTTLEGRILKETADEYILEIQVTQSIRDERKVAKADVAKVERVQADEVAFEAISKLVPAPDLLGANDYALRIAAVEKFLEDHAASDKTKAAKEVLETLKSEAAQVAAGSVKLNGKLISPEEYKSNAYDLDARVQEAKIRGLIADNQLVAALRLFVDFDRDYRKTLSHASLLPLMKQVIQAHVAEAERLLATLDARLKEREVGLDRMTPEDRVITANAINEQTAQMEELLKSDKAARQAWVTLSPYNKAALEEIVRFGNQEMDRLGKLESVVATDSGRLFREAWTAVHRGGSPAAVTTALAAAKAANVPPRYLAPLEELAKAKK